MDSFELLPPLKDIISNYDLQPDKRLGQNFLLDLNITNKIIRSAGDLGGLTVIEIGPGPGGLTRSLLQSSADKVIAIDFDPRAVKAQEPLLEIAQDRLQVIEADALTADLIKLAGGNELYICGNLPYNIATPLLIKWLRALYDTPDRIKGMTLMFQKEVGDRITAQSGTKKFGRLSVLSQWLCHTDKAFDLPPSVFIPPPKIYSSVLNFTPKTLSAQPPAFETVELVTQLAFGQRRKMLRSSLKPYLGALETSGIDPQKRAEQLTVEDFIRLCKVIDKNKA